MTEIHLHGILAKKYGKVHNFVVKEPKDVLRAFEANYENFNHDIKELLKKNIVYTIVADNCWLKSKNSFDEKKIKKIDFLPCILGAGPAVVFGIISLVVAVASAIYSYIQSGKQQYPSIPGAEGTSSASNKSMAFSNRENITEQGNPVPLAYGRLRVGSYVIQNTVKSFPLSLTLIDEFINSTNKKSNNQTAVIDASESNLAAVTTTN
jgi:predicted phage tail protein